ncbi:MAG: hypothetical protein Q9227_002861 [Pyrenula ochraceoflavens]
MAGPLSPLSPSSQNARRPSPATPEQSPSKRKIESDRQQENEYYEEYHMTSTTKKEAYIYTDGDKGQLHEENEDPPSSPFLENVETGDMHDGVSEMSRDNDEEEERNDSLSRQEVHEDDYDMPQESTRSVYATPVAPRSSSEGRNEDDDSEQQDIRERDEQSPEPSAVGEESVIHHTILDGENEEMSTIYDVSGGEDTETSINIDTADLSTFSAVPNTDMTMFANLRGASPTKSKAAWSPSKQLLGARETPATNKHSPRKISFESEADDDDMEETPRRHGAEDMTDLLNFTGQSFAFPAPTPGTAARMTRRSPSGRGAFPVRVSPTKSQAAMDRERGRSSSPSKHTHHLLYSREAVMTPAGRRHNLLDLELSPVRTPRSIPTITPRELESLRSSLQSEISSLSATLSGKEAETSALKRAVSDAEARVGKAMEECRSETLRREGLEQEKKDWEERRGEMEGVLREVRQEVLVRGRESEKAAQKAEESGRENERLVTRVAELEGQVEAARRRAAMTSSSTSNGDVTSTPGSGSIDAAVKDATERVARELHTLYKGKHEQKVAALKKSYEARWEKRVRELESQLKTAQEEIVSLNTQREATLSAAIPANVQQSIDEVEGLRGKVDESEARGKVLEARVHGLERELEVVRREGEGVRGQLERERVEKGELVGMVDEWLRLQDEVSVKAGEGNAEGGEGGGGEGLEESLLELDRGTADLKASLRRASNFNMSAVPPQTSGMSMGGRGKGSGLPAPSSSSSSGPGSRGAGESRIGRAGQLPTPRGAGKSSGSSRSSSRTRMMTTTAAAAAATPAGANTTSHVSRGGLMEGIARMGGGAGRQL